MEVLQARNYCIHSSTEQFPHDAAYALENVGLTCGFPSVEISGAVGILLPHCHLSVRIASQQVEIGALPHVGKTYGKLLVTISIQMKYPLFVPCLASGLQETQRH